MSHPKKVKLWKMILITFSSSLRDWVVVSNIFYFHPYLGKIPILTNIFQMGWFNHQLENIQCCHFSSPSWNLQGSSPEKSAWRLFWSLLGRPKNAKLGAASGKQRFGAWRWRVGGDRFFRVDVWARAATGWFFFFSRHEIQCPGKTIGISGHYLIGNWFWLVFRGDYKSWCLNERKATGWNFQIGHEKWDPFWGDQAWCKMFGAFEGIFPFDSNGPSHTGNWNNDLLTPPPNGGEK